MMHLTLVEVHLTLVEVHLTLVEGGGWGAGGVPAVLGPRRNISLRSGSILGLLNSSL